MLGQLTKFHMDYGQNNNIVPLLNFMILVIILQLGNKLKYFVDEQNVLNFLTND